MPVTVVALLILIPVNVSDGTISFLKKDLVTSDIDKLSISNVRPQSSRFFIHIGLEYLFTIWTCFMLYKEYDNIASMRLRYLASQHRRVDQFTVVVRNVPHASGKSVSDSVDRFFQTNHPEHYLCHQAVYDAKKFAKLVRQRERLQNWLDYYQLKFERHPEKRPTSKRGFLGLWGVRVDSIDYYKQQIKNLDRRMALEREKVIKDPESILPVAFVSFNSRWGAAVCAQTQQSKNPTLWLTNWAPEPRDVYWNNLAIPFVSLTVRKLVISLSVFALVFFYMIPIAFVQSLANLEGLERVAPFLRPVIELNFIKSFLQGFLPGLALKIFLYILPTVLVIMSKIEGHIAMSMLERKAAAKYYYFMLVNVFLGSIITGTAFEQLHSFLHQSATEIPRTIGVSIPMKATFFITYIMVDGWAGIAAEILRLKSLVIYHLKNMFLVKTERDRERAMDPGSVDYPETLPTLQLYFLLGIVYAVVTPILLPFILVFFALAYLVYRHQIINVYNQQYESVAAFWPHVHSRIIASLLISQLLLMGLLSTKEAANSTPLLVILPILTLAFHKYCKSRFEPAFRKYPLEEAMAKDIAERAAEPNLNLKAYLADAYLHPIFQSFVVEEEQVIQVRVDKHQSHHVSPSGSGSELSSPSPPHHVSISQHQVEHNYEQNYEHSYEHNYEHNYDYQYEAEHRNYYSYHYEGQP
ncbi:CSC1-like protein At1g32090 isoform X2 [Punica granatum]|nr:CSC1-like protein At1g32090 isoform X2 [Punica granatum]